MRLDRGTASSGAPGGEGRPDLDPRPGHGLPRGLPDRDERLRPDGRDRRRVRGRDRRRPSSRRRGAVREHAGRGSPEGVRPSRCRGAHPRPDPGERSLRVVERERRHLRSCYVRRLRAVRGDLRLERQVGSPLGGARRLDRLRPARAPRAARRGLATRRPPARGGARLRLGRLPVHGVRAQREHQRRADARDPRLGVRRRLLTGRPRRRRRGRGLHQVRIARRRSTVADLPDGLGWRPLARFGGAFALVSLLSLSVLLLEPDLGVAVRTMWNRTIAYQIERHSPFSPWDWGHGVINPCSMSNVIFLVTTSLLVRHSTRNH